MGPPQEVSSLSSAPKILGNQSKHTTQAEKQARTDAEKSLTRDDPIKLKAPRGFSKPAKKYWDSILERVEGVDLLDCLDQEMFMSYCQQLARRDALNALCEKLLSDAVKADNDKATTESTDKLESLLTKIAALERSLMSYADKLGFTPQSRARLAQKRAAAELDPDSDLFGD